ncbi:hypothetical protein CIK90_11520 [Prevotella sp. P5-126]|uniref:fimbrillin family protein n=1 Tax=Prevotella sp. P5-126 TaxID=2024216 RepID=UPI000B96E6AD|nr:fimbrillin family protein [Prevotella sp. P5-126]OYP35577.1 hypothetical protein CIK90_11520 [Prevotella sp. P5-126]
MKKIGYFMGAALLTLGSCTNEINEEGFVDKAKTISFNAYSNKTRAMDVDVTSDNMKNDHFGVVGYKSDNSIYLYKGANSAVEQTWQPSGESGSWEYSNMGDLKFWPEGSMDFYAYFPYTDNATFAESNSSSDVMTIPNVDCSHDVLFAYKGSQEKIARVPLTFNHAFSKIKGLVIEMPADGSLFKSNCQVEVQKVEFINTDTKGNVKVNNSGNASYSFNSTNVTLSETLYPVVTINKTAGNTSKNLIDNGTKAKGYLFATNSSVTNSVIGTGKTMWDGTKNLLTAGTTLENLGQVCLKLTCKVWNGTDSNKYYYVGSNSGYDDVYIPLTGNASNSNSVSTLDAGKRYTYKIVMKDNVGFTNEGDPILTPILFNVSSVTGWEEVTVTITL